MDGQSVIGWIATRPNGLTDRPTDQMKNKPASKPKTDHPIWPIDRYQQTNQPSNRLAINPTTDNPSISDRPQSNQPDKRLLLAFPVSGFYMPHFCLAGCMAVYLQAIYVIQATSSSDSHSSVWLLILTPFPITQFLRWGAWPIPASHWTGYGHYLPRPW